MGRVLASIIATAVLAVGGYSAPAWAQRVPCAERAQILTKLGKEFAERPVSFGLASNGELLEVLASKDGSWTIIFTKPNGGSCVVASGQAWKDVESAKPEPAPDPLYGNYPS